MKRLLVAGTFFSASLIFASQESPVVSFDSLTKDKQESVALEEMLAQDKPVLIKFYAEKCGPCDRLKPIFESIARSLQSQITFLEIETSLYRSTADKFDVYANPTLIFWHKGKVVNRIVGFLSEPQLRSNIKEYFNL